MVDVNGRKAQQVPMKRVLVVEDDPTIRGLVAEILREDGYAVDTATNGAIGLEKLRRRPPNMVLLDLMMPVMDGQAMVRAWRNDPRFRDVPIAVMSAARDGCAVARELGASAYVAKPFDVD